jgi:hypothetical protein
MLRFTLKFGHGEGGVAISRRRILSLSIPVLLISQEGYALYG